MHVLVCVEGSKDPFVTHDVGEGGENSLPSMEKFRPQTEGQEHSTRGRQMACAAADQVKTGHRMFWTFRSSLQSRWRAAPAQAGSRVSYPSRLTSTWEAVN